jgi:hypothetical protein
MAAAKTLRLRLRIYLPNEPYAYGTGVWIVYSLI